MDLIKAALKISNKLDNEHEKENEEYTESFYRVWISAGNYGVTRDFKFSDSRKSHNTYHVNLDDLKKLIGRRGTIMEVIKMTKQRKIYEK